MNRAILLLALLTAELLAVTTAFDALPQERVANPDSWMAYLAQAGHFAKFLTVAAAALLVLTSRRVPAYLSSLSAVTPAGLPARRIGPLVGLQLAVALAFFVITGLLFSVPTIIDETSRLPFLLLWLLTGAFLVGIWGLALAPLGFWQTFMRQERLTLLLACLAGLAAVAVAYSAQRLWGGLAHAALMLAHGMLQLVYDDVLIDTEQLRLGVKGFVVTIGYPCSGYEGIGLISLFTGLYLYVFRDEFRFPQAFMLFPIGIAAIWLFNVARIAVLIAIGAQISPEVAIGGFHSQAGWIAFLLVSAGILHLAHHSGFRKVEEGAQPAFLLRDNRAVATLLPLMAVLAVGLLTGALSAGIDWLYPLRVLAGAAAIGYCWRAFALPAPRIAPTPVLAGAAVYLLWIVLAPMRVEAEPAVMAWRIGEASLWLWLWIALRFAGTALVVPIAEELAFRGYLLSRLSRQPILLTGRIQSYWPGLVGSSVLFGLLHDAWLAGFVAGMVYGVLRQRSESIWAPIVAHAITNALLFFHLMALS